MLNIRKTRKIMVTLSIALTLAIFGVGSVMAYGFRNDTDYDEIVISTPTIIQADETVSDNIIVDDSTLYVYGQINGVVTINPGGSLIISGYGQVYGTVYVNGSLYLADNGVVTGSGTRGVVVNPGGIFNMTGGYIRGNSYTDYGGGVWVNNGIFTMDGGYIENNISDGMGGGVWVSGIYARFTLYSGYIRYNHASLGGGGVALTDSTRGAFSMYVGRIYRNTTSLNATERLPMLQTGHMTR